MKRYLSVILIFLMIFSLFSCASANTDIKVTVNGKEVLFDVAPRLIKDRTMVPVRAVFEMLGATVSWDEKENTAIGKKDGTEVKITVDNNVMLKNGEKITLDVEPQNIDGRVLVPVRAISESFGALVLWDEETKTVKITYENKEDFGLLVTFIDVGQADSAFLELPNGESMLIDAGSRDSTPTLLAFLKSKGVTKINYIIATHPHEDHIGGMDDVLNNFKADTFYMPKASATTKVFSDMLDALEKNGCKAVYASAGKTVFENGDMKAEFLAPNSASYADVNNYSAVLKLTYKNSSFLFTGDAEKLSEEEILSKGFNVKADVLKVGHHGSSTSSSYGFINAVSPKYGIISCGKDNEYGHPHRETLTTFKSFNIPLYITAESGNIEIFTNGETYDIKNKPFENSYIEPTEESVNKDEVVYITKSGKRYHKDGCSGLSKSKIPSTVSEAEAKGLTPCGNCYR